MPLDSNPSTALGKTERPGVRAFFLSIAALTVSMLLAL